MKKLLLIVLILLIANITYSYALIDNPVISPDGKRLLFESGNDIYEGSINGGRAIPITVNPAYDGAAVYSKDGKYIAFSSDRNGLTRKIFIYNIENNTISQVTSGRGYDYPLFFENNYIVFLSKYRDYGLYIYKIPINGGIPCKYFYGNASAMDANDKYLVYSYGYISKYRYKYKGSADYNIYIKKRDTKIPVMKITNYDGNDIKPILRDSLIYYISSVNDNKYDIYCYNINSKTIKRITDENININSFSISEDSKTIIYEKEFRLFKLDLASGNKNEIKYQISPDRAQENEYYETISNISNYSISSENDSLFIINSNGDMFLYYPDIINRNLTNSSFWEKNPFYIKNGEFYYTSNKDGYFNIYKGDTTGNFKQITNDTLPEDIICISDNNPYAMLYRTPLGLHLFKKNKSIKIDSGIIYNAIFSPNERYIAYAKKNRSGKSYSVYNIYIYDTKTSLINRITSKGFVCLPITFSQDSKRLFFQYEYNIERLQYYGDLFYIDLVNPKVTYKRLVTEKDTNTIKTDVNIEYSDIEDRIHQITRFKQARTYLASKNRDFILQGVSSYKSTQIYKIDLKKKNDIYDYKPEKMFDIKNAKMLDISNDGKYMYYINNNKLFMIDIASGKSSIVNFAKKVLRNRQERYKELFSEAWLLLHDYFYDPKYHGLNWNKIFEYYQSQIENVNDFNTLSCIVYRMFGDLNASHLGFYNNEKTIKNNYGDIGISYIPKKHYPYITKVQKGGPCDREGIEIKPGYFIVKIDDNELKDKDPSEFLLNKEGKKTDIYIKRNLNGKEIKYTIIPESVWDTYGRFYKELITFREHLVDSLSNSQLAYIHIKSMGNASYYDFLNSILFKYSDRKGLILDVRGNGGGFSHDYYITFFMRKPYLHIIKRYDKTNTVPMMRWDNPVIMLINRQSFSNAEIFPYAFRYMGIGKIIGVPTAGGVIGTHNIELYDGTEFRLPSQAVLQYDGINFENNPIEPDIYIDNPPEDTLFGRDRQLEKAVENLMKMLK